MDALSNKSSFQVSLVGSTLLQSMPAELTAGVAARQVKPDRERIRSILNMGSVIELQRQLLTTVMENEVSRGELPSRFGGSEQRSSLSLRQMFYYLTSGIGKIHPTV